MKFAFQEEELLFSWLILDCNHEFVCVCCLYGRGRNDMQIMPNVRDVVLELTWEAKVESISSHKVIAGSLPLEEYRWKSALH